MNPLSLKLKNKFSKERISVGLDIGTSTVKMVKLKLTKETMELCDFNLEPTPLDLEPVLKRLAESGDVKNITISVCGSAVIIRYVNFPKMNDIELKQALKFEAQKHIPFPLTEVNLDAYILKPDLVDNKMLVLLVAAKKELITQRLKSFETAGLNVNIIDIDSLALINAFNFNYSGNDNLKNKTIALLNIGASFSNLNILESGIPHLSRDIHIAGNNFTQRLQEALGLDFKSAEELKLNPDKARQKSVNLAVESVLSNLAAELRTSFDYYESQSASNVEKIFLSGGGAKFLGLKEMLTNLLGIEVEYWNPVRQINLSSNIDQEKINSLSNQLAVAIGLAMRT